MVQHNGNESFINPCLNIKIKRYADKENLKKLMKYSKDTFANKNEIPEV